MGEGSKVKKNREKPEKEGRAVKHCEACDDEHMRAQAFISQCVI